MRKVLLLFLAVLLFSGFVHAGEKKKWRIAMSNNFAGNSWRQTMIKDWEKVAALALSEGLIMEAPVFTTNESSATEQAAQLQSLILEGYDAIVLNAASPTALNAAVKEAVEAGVVVVSFDNAVTEEAAWRLYTDFEALGMGQIDFIAERFPEGNLLSVRGLAGTYTDGANNKGVLLGLEKHSGLKIIKEVYGNWTQSIAQKEVAGVLPSLPEVVAVVTQGGDGYGTYKAFEAAGRKIPLMVFGNRQDELELWKELSEKTGYESMSQAIPPGTCTIAFWMAVEILEGTDVPKEMKIPGLVIREDTRDKFLAVTPKGGDASIVYPRDWVRELILNAKAGKPDPRDPDPE